MPPPAGDYRCSVAGRCGPGCHAGDMSRSMSGMKHTQTVLIHAEIPEDKTISFYLLKQWKLYLTGSRVGLELQSLGIVFLGNPIVSHQNKLLP